MRRATCIVTRATSASSGGTYREEANLSWVTGDVHTIERRRVEANTAHTILWEADSEAGARLAPHVGRREDALPAPLQPCLAQGADVCDRLEVAIAMQEQGIMLHHYRSDAAVYRAADPSAPAPQVEVDPSRIRPRTGREIDVVLSIEVRAQQSPLFLVAASLEQLELLKACERRFLVADRSGELCTLRAAPVTEDIDPDRGVNDDHDVFPGAPCGRNRPAGEPARPDP